MLSKVLVALASLSIIACTEKKDSLLDSSGKNDTMAPATGDNATNEVKIDAADTAESAISGTVGALNDTADKAKDAASNMADKAKETAGELSDKAVDAVKSGTGTLGETGAAVADKAADVSSAAQDAVKPNQVESNVSAAPRKMMNGRQGNMDRKHMRSGKHMVNGKHTGAGMKMRKSMNSSKMSGLRKMNAAKCPVIGMKNSKVYFTAGNPQYRAVLMGRMIGGSKDNRVCISNVRVARKLGYNTSKFARK